ncbi:hypothetical protein [Methylobacterium sp. 174MFSha1.1]|uniref:DUF6894 family protein n=1 Tax=Methylobacterium sp. 174MFSha1.1 TaxID=1502749 RepID=UPI0011601199|nr:hypothetical protein [Methylobacterium sp. 174MFSha1.1]
MNQDEAGSEFASLEAAYLDAFDAIGTMTVDLMRQKANPWQYGFQITDAAGKTMLDLPFAEYLGRGRRSMLPPTSVDMQRIADELRGRRDAAAQALMRSHALQTALREQGAALQETLAETRRLLSEASRGLAAFRPMRTGSTA